jgi:hypothetical protein
VFCIQDDRPLVFHKICIYYIHSAIFRKHKNVQTCIKMSISDPYGSFYLVGSSTVPLLLHLKSLLALTFAIWLQVKKLQAGVKFIL